MQPSDLQPSSSWLHQSGGRWLRALLLVAALATPVAFAQDKPPAAPPHQLSLANKPWQGDFEQMLQRRILRVLIPYSRTLFFNDKGRERGLTAENVRDCERYLNQQYATQLGQRPLTVFLIPTTRDQLFLQLNAGQLSAEAVMHAGAEGQVPGRVACDVEPVRIGERRRVPVGRAEQRHDLLTRRDDHSADLYVFGGHAGGRQAAQPGVAQQFLDRPGDQSRIGA